jgi:hypothetical protein
MHTQHTQGNYLPIPSTLDDIDRKGHGDVGIMAIHF